MHTNAVPPIVLLQTQPQLCKINSIYILVHKVEGAQAEQGNVREMKQEEEKLLRWLMLHRLNGVFVFLMPLTATVLRLHIK